MNPEQIAAQLEAMPPRGAMPAHMMPPQGGMPAQMMPGPPEAMAQQGAMPPPQMMPPQDGAMPPQDGAMPDPVLEKLLAGDPATVQRLLEVLTASDDMEAKVQELLQAVQASGGNPEVAIGNLMMGAKSLPPDVGARLNAVLGR